MIGGVVALAYVIRKFSLYPIKIGAKSLKEVLKEGAPIFLNQIFISMYTTANLTILGFYLSDTEVGYFAGAQKIMMVANMCVILPVSTAIFPEMSKRWEEDNYVGAILERNYVMPGWSDYCYPLYYIYYHHG